MKSYLTKFGFVAIVAIIFNLGLLGPARADDDDAIKALAIFGDSLSDAGNVFAVAREIQTFPYPVIPLRPYGIDGYQFSNGPTWAQVFAAELDLPQGGKAALFRPGIFGNYAFGGARARPVAGEEVPSGIRQVYLYLADNGGTADGETLYVLQFGGNDLRDALGELLTNPDPVDAMMTVEAIIGAAIAAQVDMIKQLYFLGAREFAVANVPNLGLAPAIRIFGGDAIMAATMLSGQYNHGLETTVQALRALPGIRIREIDFFGITNDIVADPEEFDISSIDEPCIIYFHPDGAICNDPDAYLFWDGIHPTAQTHEIVGEAAAEGFDDDDDDRAGDADD